MKYDKWSILAGMATVSALILVALSYHQTILTGCWLLVGWIVLITWFAGARAPSIVLSWVLFALAVLSFVQFSFFSSSEALDIVVPDDMRDFNGKGFIVLVVATALQILGASILMSKGFSRNRKEEAELENPFGDLPPA